MLYVIFQGDIWFLQLEGKSDIFRRWNRGIKHFGNKATTIALLIHVRLSPSTSIGTQLQRQPNTGTVVKTLQVCQSSNFIPCISPGAVSMKCQLCGNIENRRRLRTFGISSQNGPLHFVTNHWQHQWPLQQWTRPKAFRVQGFSSFGASPGASPC